MKKQILSVSIMVAASATIIAVWAIPNQQNGEGVFTRENEPKSELDQEILKEQKNDNQETEDHLNEDSKLVYQENQKKKRKQNIPKKKINHIITSSTEDTLGSDLEFKDLEISDFGRGKSIKWKKTNPIDSVSKNDSL